MAHLQSNLILCEDRVDCEDMGEHRMVSALPYPTVFQHWVKTSLKKLTVE